MTRLTVSKARDEFSELLKRTARRGQRTIVSRRGEDLAAIVPIEDLRVLERMTDAEVDSRDAEDARAALAEPGDNVAWEKVKADLGL